MTKSSTFALKWPWPHILVARDIAYRKLINNLWANEFGPCTNRKISHTSSCNIERVDGNEYWHFICALLLPLLFFFASFSSFSFFHSFRCELLSLAITYTLHGCVKLPIVNISHHTFWRGRRDLRCWAETRENQTNQKISWVCLNSTEFRSINAAHIIMAMFLL